MRRHDLFPSNLRKTDDISKVEQDVAELAGLVRKFDTPMIVRMPAMLLFPVTHGDAT